MKKYLFILVGMIGLFTLCRKESMIGSDLTNLPVSVTLKLVSEEPLTKAMDETAIKDVNLLVFADKDATQRIYIPDFKSEIKFELMPGEYQVYLVSNLGQNITTFTKDMMLKFSIPIGNMQSQQLIPMAATRTLNITTGRSSLIELRLTRCAAKVNYTIEVADSVASRIKLRSIQTCNLPRYIKPFNFSDLSSAAPNMYYDGETSAVNNSRSFSRTEYLFENLQGTVPTITDQKDKSPENAPACATYIKIIARRTSDDAQIEYIVYPGGDNTSDFNIRRNTEYRMTLVIRGENNIDNRVRAYDGIYYGTANSVICTSKQVSFDVAPYRTAKSLNYAYTGVRAGNEYDAASAGLVWEDNRIVTELSLSNNILTVKTNGQKGNALIAVYDSGGTILWSWHIWCLPGDKPADEEYTNAAGEKFLMMDRNLGAIGTDLTTRYGLIYRWGRKDPFCPNKVYNVSGRKDRFINHWPKVYVQSMTLYDLYDLIYMTQHPTTYVSGYWTGLYFEIEKGLWGDPYALKTYGWSSTKSALDPCPAGYRLPNGHTWTWFENKAFPGDPHVVGTFDNGYWFQRYRGDTEGAFYPVPIENDDFRIDRDGVADMLSASEVPATSNMPYPVIYFSLGKNSGWINTAGGRSMGLVRCARE